MIRPGERPAISQPGLEAPNGLAPPFNALFRRSAAAAALLVLALSLAPSAQAQGQVCDSTTIGNVRLQDGNAVNEGRLEICADDPDDGEGPVWGVICDDYWTTTESHVACRQLGYTHAQSGAAGLLRSFFGRGTGPILLDDMLCEGDEANLLECRTSRGSMARDYIGQHNCTLNENVGIRCLDATIDASLSDLYVRDANGVVTLNPRFESAHEDYSVSVPNETTTVTVYATPSQVGAAVEYFDSNNVSLGTGASAVVSNLAVGATVVTVKVTAPDGITEMLYTVTINRAAQVSNPPPPPPPPPNDPVVTLVLSPDSISENGGVSTVTATVSPVSSVAFTVTLSAQANSPAVAGDFNLVGTTLSFGADAARSTGSITITANDNDEDASNKTVTVSGRVTASGIEAPANVTLTITDDDEPDPIDPPVNPPVVETPVVTLVLSPDSISENGGVSTVTATVSPVSSVAFTVTVSAQANSPAVAGDFNLVGTTLSFGADAARSTGSVTITANDNDEDASNKTVTVSGRVTASGIEAPANVTLTITDDDEPDPIDPPVNPPVVETPVVETPVVTLVLSPDSISENGGVSTVTATVSPVSPDAFTVTISALASLPAVAADFDLAGTTLSFSSNATNSSGSVTITAVDNSVDAPNKAVTVSGTVSLSGVDDPASVTLTITDDDGAVQNSQPKSDQPENPPGNQKPEKETPSVDPPVTQVPVVTLLLSPDTIDENGGTSTVTATASPASAQAFTVTVSANAVSPAVSGDFTLTGTTLSFAANATASTGSVTITAVDNQIDAADKTVTVSGTVSLSDAQAPADAALTITDDERAPEVSLVLMPGSISENGGMGTVTAIAWPASSEPFEVMVSAQAVAPTVPGDFRQTGNMLSFAANATESTGSVTVSAVDNRIHAPDKIVMVYGAVSRPGIADPEEPMLTIMDDEAPPVVTIALTPGSISENGGVSTVTATASPASSEAFTVTISAEAVSPAVAGDFALAGTTLGFGPNATESSGTVTISAVNNRTDAPDKSVTVSGELSLSGTDVPADVTLTIADDDEPLPELSIADASGRESDGSLVFDVSLNKPWDVPVTFDYATADGTATAGADYLSTSGTLSINAGVTSARIEVRVLPDVLNEEDESFSLSLSQVSEASLADGHAVGVITGGDPSVTAQWLARFGRTVADHVLGAVEDQLWSKRGGSQEVTVAGWNLSGPGVPVSGDGMSNGQFAQSSPGFRGFGSGGGSGWGTVGLNMPGADSHGAGPGGRGGLRLTERDLLSGSALRLNVGGFGRGEWHLWARGAYSRFDGSDGDLMMQGEVRSASVGVDYGCVRCLFGVSLTHSSADGNFGFGTRDSARVESEVTGLYPYFGYQVSDRLWVWGVAGYGTGDMTAVPVTGVEVEQADLKTRLAAVGARGDLLSGVGGYSLALKADAMMVRTKADEEIGLIETAGEARRVRVGLEGSHLASFENKSSLRSYLDLSLRGDSGDAEDGFGFEVGGGLDWYDLVPGLAVNLGARGLIAHGEDEFEEWGFSGGLRYDPTPASPEGLQVGLTRSWGAPLNGGLQSRMWADAPARHSAAMRPRQQQQFNAELAYGLETRRGIGIPWARAGLFGSGKEYRLGYSMLTRHGVPSLQVGESMYGRDYRLGWDVNVDCRAQVTLELSHIEGIREDGSDTGITLRFRSLMHRPGTLECIADLRVHTLKPGWAIH